MANGTDGELFGLTLDEGVDLRRLGEMKPGERTAEENERYIDLQHEQIIEAVRAKKELQALLRTKERGSLSTEGVGRLRYLWGYQYDIEMLVASASELAEKKIHARQRAAIA